MLKRSECDGGRVASPPLHANSKSLATVHDLTSGQVAGQQSQSDPRIDEAMRAAIIEGLVSKIEAAYAVPEAGQRAIRDLRARHCTLRGISAELSARGWRTRRASEWRLEYVARIVGASKAKI